MRSLLIWLLSVFITTFLFLTPSEAFAAPPANFQKTPVITSGLNGPSGFEIAPDGRIFILERTGKIKIYKNGQLLSTPFVDLPSVDTGDRGLIGIAFDPNFLSNHYVYFYYTGLDLLNRLVRFDASGDVAIDDQLIIFQTSSPSEQLHVGGSIRFGPDGKMYFAVGDNGYPPNAQNLTNPHGKILRINSDGTIPADNPFVNTPGVLPEIYAYGFRNPWRFQFDLVTGELYGGDVGDFSWEEVNHIKKGGNYGWPNVEGKCLTPCSSYIEPIYTYPHNNESAAVTGGPIYRAGMFPDLYTGRLFFGDYAKGFIKTINLDAFGNAISVDDFDPVAGSVVDMKVAPDGSLLYLTYIPGRLNRITYSENNQIPVVSISSNKTGGNEPLTVNFSSAGTHDPDGDPLTYTWDFGDGTNSNQPNPTKVYTQKGTYSVSLYVSDGPNTGLSNPIIIQVGIPPTTTIALPKEGDTYKAGDTITVNVFGQDSAGFDLDDGKLSTEVVLHHGTHIHPFLGPLIGRAHTFVIPQTGEPSADTWYEITTTATDASGLNSKKSVNIFPIKTNITLNTQPAGLAMTLDGIPQNTPETIQAVVGFKRELSVPFVQKLGSDYYQFQSWSDGGAPKHIITTPATATTYTANFAKVSSFTGQYFDNQNLAGAPKLTRTDNFVDFFWDLGSPDPSIPINQFSARWVVNQSFPLGRYKFTTSTDDGVRLFIDGQLVIDQWHDQGTVDYTAVVDLTAGVHEIKMEYYEAFGGSVAKLNWDLTPDQPTPTPSPTPAVTSTPIPTATPTPGPVVITRLGGLNLDGYCGSINQPGVTLTNNIWYCNNGGTAINMTNACRWEYTNPAAYAQQDAPGNPYTWTCYVATGGPTPTPTAIPSATPTVAPTATPVPNSGYLANYWNTPGTAAMPQIPTTTPTLSRVETTINNVWDGGSPAPSVNVDHFVAVWTKAAAFSAGTYRFTTNSDDGIRVFIDGTAIIDDWNDHAMKTDTVDRVVTAGNHDLKIEYYENNGGAIAKFDYVLIAAGPTPTPAPSASIVPTATPAPTPTPIPSATWTGEYFDNQTLAGTPKLTRQDAAIDFVWNEGSPDPLIPTDHFSVRWTKQKTYTAGTYDFELKSDDGIRFFIDNQMIYEDWTDHAMSTIQRSVPITAGTHTLKVEYYESTGGTVAIFTEK